MTYAGQLDLEPSGDVGINLPRARGPLVWNPYHASFNSFPEVQPQIAYAREDPSEMLTRA